MFSGVIAHGGRAQCTYHMYQPNQSLTEVSCSDGTNGIINWGLSDISSMFPYVTAWQEITWNSPNCGTCLRVSFNGKAIHVTALDYCGEAGNGVSHLDLAR
jgi:hypothetical protein